jgi:hypothetical protein
MLIGACWPYLDQRLAPQETWETLDQLAAGCVRICSNAAREDVAGLHERHTGLRWVLRTRDPKLDWAGQPFPPGAEVRPGLLYYRAWPSEPTLHETLVQLLNWGCTVDVELWNEPDLEWDEATSQAPDSWARIAGDCRQYLEWQLGEIRRAFPGERRLRLAGPALSEGWPERHQVWLDTLDSLYRQCDALAIHAYTNGLAYNDPDWGGRPLVYRDRFPDKPLLLTEVNDNGHAGTQDPFSRGSEVGNYLAWLQQSCPEVELACLFALPGQGGTPAWWSWTGEMLAGLQHSFQPEILGSRPSKRRP